MKLLFSLTLLVGSFLLFLVQPMIGKMVLPLLGGTPAVWITCMVFFQAALFAGYAYAHVTTVWLGVRRQAALQAGLVLLPALVLPIRIRTYATDATPLGANPTLRLLELLIGAVGLPFFLLATTAPLLQRWFSETSHRDAKDPYFLYAASNLGSVAALVSYPIVLEPVLRLSQQGLFWSTGYGLLAGLILACAVQVWCSPGPAACAASKSAFVAGGRRLGIVPWARWMVLAFIPSSLMLGVTTYLTTDISAMPLFWVIPLALYILTFILVFAQRPLISHTLMVRALPIAVMALTPAMCAGLVHSFWIPLHLLVFFTAAMVCHGELARQRPTALQLTQFYLALSLGGVLGGIFNALVAPIAFDRVAEYPIALVLACLVLPGAFADVRTLKTCAREAVIPTIVFLLMAGLVVNIWGVSDTLLGVLGVMIVSALVSLMCWTHRSRPGRFALGIGAALLASGLWEGVDGRTLSRERSFFGVWRVTQVEAGNFHRLFHGTTLHGQQCLDPDRRREPLTYFSRTGPIGQVFEALRSRTDRLSVAVMGLGAGSLACYAQPGERWTFYEIDRTVVRIARDPRYFTFLRDCPAGTLDVVMGDARVELRSASRHGYGLIIFDAFSSDAIPIHLLTREAIQVYRHKLAEGGVIAFHISNRHFDLAPVLGVLAQDANLVCRVRSDTIVTPDEKRQGKQASIWAVMAANAADLGALTRDPRWKPPMFRSSETVWTDDYSNLIEHFIINPR